MRRISRSYLPASDTELGRVASKLGANLLLGILLFGLSTTGQIAHAQKSSGSGTPVLPKVRYTLTKLQFVPGLPVWVSAPNDVGDGVGTSYSQFGSRTALAYQYGTGGSPVIFDLNGLGAPWYDLNEVVSSGNVPTQVSGWRAPWAYGLNLAGEIVGYAENTVNPSLPLRAYLLENAFGNAPRFLLLPTVGAVSHYAKGINISGEIVVDVDGLGVFRYKRRTDGAWPYFEVPASAAIPGNIGGGNINDYGTIIAQAGGLPVGKYGSYRQLDGHPAVYFSGYLFSALSNHYIGGSRDTIGKVKGGAIRMPELGAAGSEQNIFSGSIGNYVRRINDDGDLCFESSGRVFLYYDADSKLSTPNLYGTNGNGILPLDQMVDSPDADWLNNTNYIRVTGISQRGPTSLGQICVINFGSNQGFLLTPHPIP